MAQRCDPTPATVKALYGSASVCGEPNCEQPLYKTRPDRTAAFRNSTVAHINAATPNGPRPCTPFDCDYVRSFENLILLCHEHSNEIDQFPDDYPVELLKEWKAQQLEQGKGSDETFQITDAQVAEILGQEIGARPVWLVEASQLARTGAEMKHEIEHAMKYVTAAADRWDQKRQKIENRVIGWDPKTGESVRTVVSHRDKAEGEKPIIEALNGAVKEAEPKVHSVRIAADGMAAALGDICDPFKDELEWCLKFVEKEISRYPSQYDDALQQSQTAINHLCALARGENVEPPPKRDKDEQPKPEPTQTEQYLAKLNEVVNDLAERSAPFSRVKTRPYDNQLAEEILEVVPTLAEFPEVMQHETYPLLKLSSVVGRLAAISRNATQEQFSELVEKMPESYAARIRILRRLWQVAHEDGNETRVELLEAAIKSECQDGLDRFDTPEFWSENFEHTIPILHVMKHFKIDYQTKIENVIATNPNVSLVIIPSLGSWEMNLDMYGGPSTNVYRISEHANLADLVPVIALGKAARIEAPHIPAVAPWTTPEGVDNERLIGEFLHHFGEQPDH